MHYSNGLLADIHESLWPLRENPSLKRKFLEVFGSTGNPEWSELLRFIDDRENIAETPLGSASWAEGSISNGCRDCERTSTK